MLSGSISGSLWPTRFSGRTGAKPARDAVDERDQAGSGGDDGSSPASASPSMGEEGCWASIIVAPMRVEAEETSAFSRSKKAHLTQGDSAKARPQHKALSNIHCGTSKACGSRILESADYVEGIFPPGHDLSP